MSNNLSADNITEWLHQQMGPPHLPLATAVPLTIIFVVIFISGLLGNIAVCLVITRHRAMHTATNYYLFNLAISDLILLIFGLPYDAALCWHQYPWTLGDEFCKIRTLFSEMASYVSVLTIVAFSTERYLAICYPLYLYTMSGFQRAIRIIICLWLVSFLSALPFSFSVTVQYLTFPPNSTNQIEESAFCGMFSETAPFAEISATVFFVVPMLAIGVQYTRMGLQIAKSTKKGLGKGLKGSVHRDSTRNMQSNRIIIRMLAAVVLGFFICWAPFHAQRLFAIYGPDDFQDTTDLIFFSTGILYYFQSTLNPLLYNIMSDRYRTAFREILCGRRPTRRSLMRSSTFRETRLVSQSDLQPPLYNNRNSSSYLVRSQRSNQVKDDDKLQLMDQEIITVATPKTGSTIIYEINFTKDNCEYRGKDNCETCI